MIEYTCDICKGKANNFCREVNLITRSNLDSNSPDHQLYSAYHSRPVRVYHICYECEDRIFKKKEEVSEPAEPCSSRGLFTI